MPRPPAMPSVARVYANVNGDRGPAWYEYGEPSSCDFDIAVACVCSCRNATDNLQVQWGMQDHYEIVRKVGRGKYSEVGARYAY